MNVFKKYLRVNDIKNSEAAQALGIAEAHLSLIINDHRYPGVDLAAAIEAYTKGKVKASVLRRPAKDRIPCPHCGRIYTPKKPVDQKI